MQYNDIVAEMRNTGVEGVSPLPLVFCGRLKGASTKTKGALIVWTQLKESNNKIIIQQEKARVYYFTNHMKNTNNVIVDIVVI